MCVVPLLTSEALEPWLIPARGAASLRLGMRLHGALCDRQLRRRRSALRELFQYAFALTRRLRRSLCARRPQLFMKPLHYAALRGHAAVVTALVERGANAEATIEDRKRYTARCASSPVASRGALTRRRRRCRRRRSRCVGRTQGGWTPLHCAASEGHASVVRALLERGANVEAKDMVRCARVASHHRGPLSRAPEYSSPKQFHGLFVRCMSKATTPPCGRGAALTPPARAPIADTTQVGNTPLHIAESWGKAECVRLLVQRSANMGAGNNVRRAAALRRVRGRLTRRVAERQDAR